MTKSSFSWSGIAAVVVGFSVLVTLANRCSSEPPSGPPVLKLSAGRTTVGFSFTNREAVPISKCDVTLLDQGDDQWVAAVPGSAVASETLTVPWSAFTANGQPMPSYIGQTRKHLIVSCFVESVNARRSAGISF